MDGLGSLFSDIERSVLDCGWLSSGRAEAFMAKPMALLGADHSVQVQQIP